MAESGGSGHVCFVTTYLQEWEDGFANPFVASTRKVYEQNLVQLSVPPPCAPPMLNGPRKPDGSKDKDDSEELIIPLKGDLRLSIEKSKDSKKNPVFEIQEKQEDMLKPKSGCNNFKMLRKSKTIPLHLNPKQASHVQPTVTNQRKNNQSDKIAPPSVLFLVLQKDLGHLFTEDTTDCLSDGSFAMEVHKAHFLLERKLCLNPGALDSPKSKDEKSQDRKQEGSQNPQAHSGDGNPGIGRPGHVQRPFSGTRKPPRVFMRKRCSARAQNTRIKSRTIPQEKEPCMGGPSGVGGLFPLCLQLAVLGILIIVVFVYITMEKKPLFG
ncbi:LEM domain-containing protein 1 [Heterocephalus glaber]|uniref:LEM domain-containing protein 1 n=1 Tax=Heterocephalus glaber TaxID=10181 RepID=A0AAX6RM49_HETGA|nr:LEM domain-containing protein 1 [Heterocephalus glaber]